MSTDTQKVNDAVFQALSDPQVSAAAVDAINNFTRHRMQDDGLMYEMTFGPRLKVVARRLRSRREGRRFYSARSLWREDYRRARCYGVRDPQVAHRDRERLDELYGEQCKAMYDVLGLIDAAAARNGDRT